MFEQAFFLAFEPDGSTVDTVDAAVAIAELDIVGYTAQVGEGWEAEAEGATAFGFGAEGGDSAVGVESVDVVVAEGEGDDRGVLEGGDEGGCWW